MERRHSQKLTSNASMLTRDLVVNEEFLSAFEDNGVFTANMVEDIMAQTTKSGKTGKFRGYLPMRGPKAFPTFIEALVATQQDHIAQRLDPTRAEKLIKERDSASEEADAYGAPSAPSSRRIQDKGEAMIENIDILDVDSHKARTLLGNTDSVYPMKSKPRGRAIILNIEYFESETQREGSALDAMNITNLFERLHFTTEVWPNLSAQEIWDKIEGERKHEAHKDADAFIFVILSHGNRGNIMSSDEQDINLEQVYAAFDGKRCPALRGKPKIFIIEACRGEEVDKSLVQADCDSYAGNPIQESKQLQNPYQGVEQWAHEKAGFIVASATFPGYKAWRDIRTGSWFIRDLIYTFMNRCHQDHLQDMLVEVNNKVGKRAKSTTTQVTDVQSTLDKKVYFLPGYSE